GDEEVVGDGTRHAPVDPEGAGRERQVGHEDEVVVEGVPGSQGGPEHEGAEEEADEGPDGPGPTPEARGDHHPDRCSASTSLKASPMATHWVARSWWVSTYRRLAAPTSARRSGS